MSDPSRKETTKLHSDDLFAVCATLAYAHEVEDRKAAQAWLDRHHITEKDALKELARRGCIAA